MTSGAWFGPKTYGYGIAPHRWQGWLATLAYVLLLTGGIRLLRLLSQTAAEPVQLALSMGWVVLVTGAFLLLVRAKTAGEMRWRWGGRG